MPWRAEYSTEILSQLGSLTHRNLSKEYMNEIYKGIEAEKNTDKHLILSVSTPSTNFLLFKSSITLGTL